MKKEEILNYKDELLADLATLVSYPSIYSEDAKPFGKANIDCLNKALEIAKGYGFKTVNMDNYCGYIEMGQGEEIIGILAHLDVVPVSDTWTSDPFTMVERDGKYYGRGTTDDKGAAIASLTAMRMLKQLEPTFTKRVRLILGCNEETGSRGVKHYVEKEGYVNCGFTPDGNFPLVYGEKGMVSAIFSGKSEKVLDVKGGTVSNAVASRCVFTLADNCIDPAKLDEYFKANDVEYTLEGNELTVIGVAAHASMPELGKNAISYGFEGLYNAGINDELVDAYHKYIGIDYYGSNASVGFKDDYGLLTFNIGLAYKEDDEIKCTIDIRFPLTMQSKDVMEPLANCNGGYITVKGGGESLFFPPDHPMIKALMKAYVDATGDTVTQPMTIGGGTYAKSMKGIVAFGCEDDECNYHIHDDDEFVTWASLEKQIACYYEAILNLMKI